MKLPFSELYEQIITKMVEDRFSTRIDAAMLQQNSMFTFMESEQRNTASTQMLAPQSIAGMRLVANPHMDRFRTIEVPPNTKFIEYEKSDYVWLRYFGMMRTVVTDEMLIYQLGDRIVTHPDNFEALKARMKQ